MSSYEAREDQHADVIAAYRAEVARYREALEDIAANGFPSDAVVARKALGRALDGSEDG